MEIATTEQPSRSWSFGFRVLYWLLGLLDPLLRMIWLQSGLGNVIEVTIEGRSTGKPRRTFPLAFSRPAGTGTSAQWTRNLDAAGGRLLVGWPGQAPVSFRADPAAWSGA